MDNAFLDGNRWKVYWDMRRQETVNDVLGAELQDELSWTAIIRNVRHWLRTTFSITAVSLSDQGAESCVRMIIRTGHKENEEVDIGSRHEAQRLYQKQLLYYPLVRQPFATLAGVPCTHT
jgi:hypothetical protein